MSEPQSRRSESGFPMVKRGCWAAEHGGCGCLGTCRELVPAPWALRVLELTSQLEVMQRVAERDSLPDHFVADLNTLRHALRELIGQ